jgi:hypothetical protein
VVTVRGKYADARSVIYICGKIYVCEYGTAIKVVAFNKDAKVDIKKMKKPDLQNELAKRNMPSHGLVSELKTRLQKYIQEKSQAYKSKGVELDRILLSTDINPCRIAKASDSVIVTGSDLKRKVYQVTIDNDLVLDTGEVSEVADYHEGCKTLLGLCVSESIVYGRIIN